MKNEYAPRALREVWGWKDSIYQDVKHLPTRRALQAIMESAGKVAKECGFGASRLLKKRLAVAESHAEYRISATKTGGNS